MSPPKNNHQIFYYPHTIVFSFIRMCILAINLFRAFVCAMFKVFITSVSPCKMRANLTPFRSVATSPLRLSKFKPTEMKNSGSHLHSPHLRCSRSSRGSSYCGGQCGLQKFPISVDSPIGSCWLNYSSLNSACRREPLFHVSFLQINSDLECSPSSDPWKTRRSIPPKEANGHNNH